MNRALSKASERSRAFYLGGFGLFAASLLVAGSLKAEDPPKGPAVAALSLKDGGFVAGQLDGSDQADRIRWKSPAFSGPLEFALEKVQSIRFPVADKLPRPTGAFGFELTGGDVLFGSIVGLDDKKAELEVARLGKISVDRSRLRRIFRWKDGADLIYNGPNGLTGWKEVSPAKPPKPPNAQNGQNAMVGMAFGFAQAPAPPQPPKPAAPVGPAWVEEAGQIQTNRSASAIQANVELPAKSSLEIELSWKKAPDFVLALAVGDSEESVHRAFRFEVWDGQIVALRSLEQEADVVPVHKLGEGPGRVQLQLFLDQEKGKLLVYSTSGTLLAELKPAGTFGPVQTGIRLTNLQGDIRLERLRIGRWDGETPNPVDPTLSRVQLTDLSTTRGQVERLDTATHEFVVKGESGESRISEDKVSNIFLTPPADLAPRSIRAIYQDGTRIGGDLSKVDDETIVMNAPGIEGSMKAPVQGLRSLDVLRNDPTDPKELAFNEKPVEKPVEKPAEKPAFSGTLEMEGIKLAGHLADTNGGPGGTPLAWKADSSSTVAPIRPEASGRIIYKTIPAPAPLTPAQRAAAQRAALIAAQQRDAAARNPVNAMMGAFQGSSTKSGSSFRRSIYLRTGDIIPAEITKIDEKGVTFKSEISPNGFVPHSRIKAVEMANDSPNAMKLTKTKFERLMTLPRMQRDSPPTQLIRSKNGDFLRARIVSMDDQTIRVEVRLEEKEIPRDRVSRIIWFHADEVDPAKKALEPDPVDGNARVQAVRSDGTRLTFHANRFVDGTIEGRSDVLGDCKVKLGEVDQLLIGGSVEKEATQLAYQNWKLQNAPDPKSASEDEDSGGGAAGTESAMVGKPAPDFELELLGGKKFHLADSKGHVVVLDFWATWCGPCLQAMPQIDKVTHEFADKGVELIAVNLQEGPEKIKAMLERQKLAPTVALDRDGVVAQRYAANAIPQTVVIDAEGKVTRLFIGGGPKLGDQLRDALKELIPDEKK